LVGSCTRSYTFGRILYKILQVDLATVQDPIQDPAGSCRILDKILQDP